MEALSRKWRRRSFHLPVPWSKRRATESACAAANLPGMSVTLRPPLARFLPAEAFLTQALWRMGLRSVRWEWVGFLAQVVVQAS